jgi:hypothetical protein
VERLPRCAGHAQSKEGQHIAIDCQSLVDLAAHEQLEGERPAQLLELGRAGVLAGTKILPRRLARSPRVRQRVGEIAPQPLLLVGADAQFERSAKERGCAIERQSLRGFPRRPVVIVAGLPRLLGGIEVDRQGLGISMSRAFQPFASRSCQYFSRAGRWTTVSAIRSW